MTFFQFILEPLSYPFMFKAVLVSVVVGAVCAILSCFLILKSWSLLGDAISHAVLPGVVIAYILGIPLGIGAFVFALIAVVLIGFINSNSKVKEDAVMGIVFTTLFSLGLILVSQVESSLNLTHVLFGQLLGISDTSAFYTIGILSLVALVTLIFRKTFIAFCFDPVHAQSVGISVKKINYALLVLLAITITGSLQVVGIILVVAMLITPGSTAFLLTKNFSAMMWLAVFVSVFCSVFGAYASFYFDVSVGGAIVFMQGVVFLLVFFYQSFLKKLKTKNQLVLD